MNQPIDLNEVASQLYYKASIRLERVRWMQESEAATAHHADATLRLDMASADLARVHRYAKELAAAQDQENVL